MLQEVEAFKAAVEAKDIRTAASVTLSGAEGNNADKINQQFVATQERLNGAPVFVGVDESSRCLCIAANGNWYVQPVEEKGRNRGTACVKDKSSPLDPAAQWRVADGKGGWEDQSVRASANYKCDLQAFCDWKEVACSHTDSSLWLPHPLQSVSLLAVSAQGLRHEARKPSVFTNCCCNLLCANPFCCRPSSSAEWSSGLCCPCGTCDWNGCTDCMWCVVACTPESILGQSQKLLANQGYDPGLEAKTSGRCSCLLLPCGLVGMPAVRCLYGLPWLWMCNGGTQSSRGTCCPHRNSVTLPCWNCDNPSMRETVRNQYGIAGSDCQDTLVNCCCLPGCAWLSTAQLMREMRMRQSCHEEYQRQVPMSELAH